jgi:hypothetical protein
MTKSSTVFITETLVYPEAAAILHAAGQLLWGLPEDQRVRPASGQHFAEQVALIRTVLAGVLPEVDAFYGYFPYDAALIEAATRLQVIITPSSGAEHVDLGAATAHGVAVVNAAGAAYGPVAEHVIGLALSLLKCIAIPDRVAHSQSSALSSGQILNRPRLPSMLNGKTIGIVGLGFIGREIARIAGYGFRMTVLAYDPYFDPAEARRQGVSLVARLADLLAESDVVTVNCPLTPQTDGIIGASSAGPDEAVRDPHQLLARRDGRHRRPSGRADRGNDRRGRPRRHRPRAAARWPSAVRPGERGAHAAYRGGLHRGDGQPGRPERPRRRAGAQRRAALSSCQSRGMAAKEGTAMKYIFVNGRVAIVVRYWEQSGGGVAEGGARVDLRRVEQVEGRQHREGAAGLTVAPVGDGGIWRADLFMVLSEPGTSRFHYHPKFTDGDVGDRFTADDLTADPRGWIADQLGDIAGLLEASGAGNLVRSVDLTEHQRALPLILASVDACLARVPDRLARFQAARA